MKLRGDLARLNFHNLRHQGSSLDDYKPLHPSVFAKLQTICEGLVDLQKKPKPEKTKSEENICKVEAASSSEMESEESAGSGSSPLSGPIL